MRGRWLKQKRRMVVYTTEGDILDGLAIRDARDGLVLIDVKIISDDAAQPGGEIFVPTSKIRFVQAI